jgi:hypothetical protein
LVSAKVVDFLGENINNIRKATEAVLHANKVFGLEINSEETK